MNDKAEFLKFLRESLGNGEIGDLIGDIARAFPDETDYYVPVSEESAQIFFNLIADAIFG